MSPFVVTVLGDMTAIEFSISKPFLSIEFVFWFWENQKEKLEIFEEACCSTTFEAAALAQYWGETAISSCCCFEIPKSGKQ